ncbi:MAG: QueT transporter family protein [Nitrososphaerota archaeon]|nr:QueT transporter family protein [Nitrososphaerota archaeon]MDG6903775.1 QueT transporter family protein [Nitrososphaerota archaeon]MDG6911592.1 QueT transporter family protein [Nitrososphaerota archaeon]MDG6940496.1 QueT transporter family protein [Nitrososphaerota archaeon]MDG6960807.1 QueT transporter family protein [Nitrososphaerota archaeon]
MRRSLVVATAAVYAAMYVVLVVVFSPISYGVINLRVANVLIGLVPLLGWPAIIGQTLGVFIANQPAFGDPLGPIDLINVLPTFVFTWVIWRLRKKSVLLGLTVYAVALGVSVSYALSYAFNLPLFVEIPQVTAGIFLATTVLGYLFYRAVGRLGVLQRRYGT